MRFTPEANWQPINWQSQSRTYRPNTAPKQVSYFGTTVQHIGCPIDWEKGTGVINLARNYSHPIFSFSGSGGAQLDATQLLFGIKLATLQRMTRPIRFQDHDSIQFITNRTLRGPFLAYLKSQDKKINP